jgi:hypothetical protein
MEDYNSGYDFKEALTKGAPGFPPPSIAVYSALFSFTNI